MLIRCFDTNVTDRSSCLLWFLATAAIACGGSVQRDPCPDGGSGPGCQRAPDAGPPPDAAPPDATPPEAEAAPDAGIRECPGSCAAQDLLCDTRRGECVECLTNQDCPNHKALCQAGTCVECPLPEACGTSCCGPEDWVRQVYGWACVGAADRYARGSLDEAKYCDPRAHKEDRARNNRLARGLRAGRIRVDEARLAECKSEPQQYLACLKILAATQKAGQACSSGVECEHGVCDQSLACGEGVCAGPPARVPGRCLDSEIPLDGGCLVIKDGDPCPRSQSGVWAACPPPLSCSAGRCRGPARRGESCETRRCEDDLYCNPVGNLCSVFPSDGEACSGGARGGCAPEHDCIGGTCRAWLAAGAACDFTTARCGRGLRCHNGACLPLAYHSDPCGPDVVCVQGTLCQAPPERPRARLQCRGGPYQDNYCDETTICLEGTCCLDDTCRQQVCRPVRTAEDGRGAPNPCGRDHYPSGMYRTPCLRRGKEGEGCLATQPRSCLLGLVCGAGRCVPDCAAAAPTAGP